MDLARHSVGALPRLAAPGERAGAQTTRALARYRARMLKLLFLSLTIFSSAASALLPPGATESPETALKGTVDALLANLKQHAPQYRRDQESFYAMVDQVVVPRFDVAGIAQFALGKHSRAATPEQRQR